jgi:hypothetical protein
VYAGVETLLEVWLMTLCLADPRHTLEYWTSLEVHEEMATMIVES